MNETNRTYPNLVAKIQVYMSNKTQNSNYFSLLRKSGSYKNMLNFMAIVYIKSTLSEYGHVAYQIKRTEAYCHMLAKVLLLNC